MDVDALFELLTKQERTVLRSIACANQSDAEVAAILGTAEISANLAALIEREEEREDKRNYWDLAKFARHRIPVLLDIKRD